MAFGFWNRGASRALSQGGSGAPVASVNGQIGAVVLDHTDVGADQAGTAAAEVAAHEALPDPHPQYTTPGEVDTEIENRQAVVTPSAVSTSGSVGQSDRFALEDHIHADRLTDGQIILLSRVMN